LSELEVVLRTVRDRLQQFATGADRGWHQIANLRFSPAVPRKTRAAITKVGDAWTGAAILGLAVSLSAWFRECSAPERRSVRYVGEQLRRDGKPAWKHVADFVNSALELDPPDCEDSIRQRVHTVCSGRDVRIMNWPRAAVREPQVQKE
jgi:hypothetical protein